MTTTKKRAAKAATETATGVKSGVVKDRSGGNTLLSFAVTVH